MRGSGSPSSARSRRMRSTRTAWWPSARHAPLRSAPSCECESPDRLRPRPPLCPVELRQPSPLATSLPQCPPLHPLGSIVSHAAQSGFAVRFARRFRAAVFLCGCPTATVALACKRHSISGFDRSVGAAAALGPLSHCSQVIGFASDVLDNWERVLEIHALYRPSSAKWHASSPHVMSMVVRHKRSGAMQARLVVVSPLRSACAWTAPPAQTCSHTPILARPRMLQAADLCPARAAACA